VGVFNDSANRIYTYYDGCECDNTTEKNVPGDRKLPLYIGSRGGKKHFTDGIIDEVTVYDRPLSAGEILEHYNTFKPKESGLVSIWHMDENSGSTVTDSAGNNDGEVHEAVWSTGVNNSALRFDGIDDHIFVPASDSLTGMDKLTIEAWVNLDDLGGVYRDVVGKDSQYKLRLSPSGEAYKLSGVIYLDGEYNSITADWEDKIAKTQQWYYLVFTYNGSYLNLYINGEIKKTKEAKGSIKIKDNYLSIGGKPYAKHTVGGIVDEVAIYDIALTPKEIKQYYDANKPQENVTAEKVSYRVSVSTNDAEEHESGSVDVISSDLELVHDSSDQEVGMRFIDVDIPQGSTIESASLEFTVDEYKTQTTNLVIYGHDIDDSYKFSTNNYDITRRDKTKNSVQWSVNSTPVVGEHLISPDISGIVQEIIDRPGWSLGNTLSIIINGTVKRTVESYNGDSDNAPLLRISYATKENVSEGGLVSYWNLDESSGTTATDSIRDNDGTITGATWTTGVSGNALNFDGEDDYVDISGINNLLSDSLAAQGTLSFWTKIDEKSGSQYLFHIFDNNDNSEIRIEYKSYIPSYNDQIRFIYKSWNNRILYTYNYMPVPMKAGDNQWHHIVLTWDNTTMTAYVDGQKFGESIDISKVDWNPTLDETTIGTKCTGYPGSGGKPTNTFKGSIDEIAIYNVVLSSDEILAHYNAFKPDDIPPTIELNNPPDSNISQTKNITFQYTPDDENSSIAFCELVINSTVDQIDYTITEGTVNEFTKYSLSEGTYTWCVNCTDNSTNANQGSSKNRTLIVETPKTSVSRWYLNENTGSIAYDSIDGNDGTIKGAAWTTGVNGSALDFDGINDYISVSESDNLNMGGSDYTIEAWVKVDDSITYKDERILVEYGTWQSGTYQLTSKNDNQYKTNFYGRSSSQGSECKVDWTDSKWHHLVGVFNNSANCLYTYYDGCLCDEIKEKNAPANKKLPLYIGSRGGKKHFTDGTIDEVTIYDRPLSAGEVLEHYNTLKPKESDLVSIWHMDENSGLTVKDSTGDNDAKISGATWTAGVNGSALTFNGLNDYVIIADNHNLNLTSEGTIEAWINPKTHKKYAGIVHKGEKKDFSDEAYSLQFWDPGTIMVGLFASSTKYLTLESIGILNTGQWYHVAATWNSSTVYLYINGEENNSRSNTIGNVRNTDGGLVVGAQLTEPYSSYYGHFGFDGSVDEVVIYDRMLTSKEIQQRYDTNKPKEDKKMVSQWHLNENSGVTAYDSINTNDGKIIGASWVTGVNNSALHFDGIDDSIDCGKDTSLDITNTITIEAWAKAAEHKTAKIVEKGDWDGHDIGQDIWNGWKCGVYIKDDKNKKKKYKVDWGAGKVTLNQWYHVVLTYDGSKLRLYVDGIEKNSEPVTGNLVINSRNFCIGSDNGKQKFFNGTIDEVTIYETVLTPKEIQEHYESYKKPKKTVKQ